MKYIREAGNLKGVKVLVRLDLNVPVVNGKVADDFRIRKIIPTLNFLKEAGARSILISHIETLPENGGPTLAPVSEALKMLGIPVGFVKNMKNALGAIEKMADGDFVLLENLRLNDGEETNDKSFAKELASLSDIYMNDAFSVSHRMHASLSAVTEFLPSYAGPHLESEVKNLSTAFNPDPVDGRPFLFILAGAKFETKLPLIEKFIGLADTVFVGGALANDFYKEKGIEVGRSRLSSLNFKLSRFFNDPKLMLPVDVVVCGEEPDSLSGSTPKDVGKVLSTDKILDSGPETVRALGEKIIKAKYILWNGPLGAYEQGFKGPTLELSRMIADATGRGTKTIVGGGDTLATIAELGIEDKFTFISTGGGAMLDYLATGTLPAIEALNASKL